MIESCSELIYDARLRSWRLPPVRPVFVGIVNCTPDSFSDGSAQSSAQLVEKALALVEAGAELLDLGGESTRPGAQEIHPDLECRRVLPVLEGIRRYSQVPLSIDTRRSSVAKRALQAGAVIVNDVSGFSYDPEGMQALIEAYQPGLICVHSRATPQTMQDPQHCHYGRVSVDVAAQLQGRIETLLQWGSSLGQICVDPGFGFAKTASQCVEMLHDLNPLHELKCPVMIALSRKAFLGDASRESRPSDRDPETCAALAIAYQQGFQLFRVHDVKMCRKFFSVYSRGCT